jgi:hypothetical protein
VDAYKKSEDNDLMHTMEKEQLYTGPVSRYVWHVSNKIHRESIAKTGLIPQTFEKSVWAQSPELYYPPAIFVNNHDNYDEWFHLDESKYIPSTTFETDVWRIDTSKLDLKWYLDLNKGGKSEYLYTKEMIPVESIQLFIVNKLSCVECGTIICNLHLDDALRPSEDEDKEQIEYIHEYCIKFHYRDEVDVDEWAEEQIKNGKIKYLPKSNLDWRGFDLIR